KKLAKGKFDLDDLADQLGQMSRMVGMEGLLGLLSGVQRIKRQIAEANLNDKIITRQRAIIGSMTKTERKKPDILQASRKRRIAAGAGVDVAEVNRLLKQHRQMQDAFKFMAMGGGSMDQLKHMGGGKRLAEAGAAPPGAPQALPPGLTGAPRAPNLPGLGATSRPSALPGLGGGFNPFK